MLIQCTKKLLDQLNIKPESQVEDEALFSWHAHFLTLNRRKAIVLMNDKNRYVILLYGLKAKDLKNLDELILKAIRQVFEEECINDQIIECFINHSKTINYTKTKNRSMVARLNKSVDSVYFYGELLNNESVINSRLSTKASRLIVGDGKNDYIRPNEELYKDLLVFAGEPIFSTKAVELKVTLSLENHHVWRRLIVPVNLTFNQLHKVLQEAFGWSDYHLHEFYIYDHTRTDYHHSINHSAFNKQGYKPIVNLVDNQEAFAYPYDVEMKLEVGIKLSEYIPQYSTLKYNYDFGDNWQHHIEVVNVLDDYDKNYPICLEGEGNTPPEDVGGEGGYDEFLNIVKDKNHPEHSYLVDWAAGQGYKEFDIDQVNRLLKNKKLTKNSWIGSLFIV